MKQTKVAYILGYGHSGSTVLNIVLAQHSDMHGAGELCLLARAWTHEEYCSCGDKIAACPMWSAVVGRWREKLATDPILLQRKLQIACERVDAGSFVGFASTSGPFDEYAELTGQLLASIRAVTGKSWVIDSSKRAGRAFALARVSDVDLRVVHLVRDGRGVVWSMRRSLEKNPAIGLQTSKRPQPASRTSLAWNGANLAAEGLRRRLGRNRSLRLRYEDLVTDPKGSLDRIGAMTGLDFGDLAARLQAGEALDPGHVVAGNRMRMAGPVRLRYDQEWRTRLPRAQRVVAALLCRPLLHRYGYD